MIKNDDNKKMIGCDTINNSNDFNSSTRPTSFQKMKFRKDAKGNLILKKKIQIKKSKHHAYFIDKLNTEKDLVSIIDIESYKRYNIDNEDEEMEEEIKDLTQEEENNLVSDKQIINSNRCCTCAIF